MNKKSNKWIIRIILTLSVFFALEFAIYKGYEWKANHYLKEEKEVSMYDYHPEPKIQIIDPDSSGKNFSENWR